MLLKLRNVGMIESADIRIDGLSVIAGENGVGKSTVAKTIFALVKADMIALAKTSKLKKPHSEFFLETFNQQIFHLFKGQISLDGNIEMENDDSCYQLDIVDHKAVRCKAPAFGIDRPLKDVLYVQTPLIWDLMETFQSISNYRAESELLDVMATKIVYPFVLWELFLRLSSSKGGEEGVREETLHIEETIGGRFEKGSDGRFRFVSDGQSFELNNVASGIKQFGILQRLAENGQLTSKTLLAYDEPEVHLHPKWELKMAEKIVLLVKSGVSVLINTHSPYMLEALKLFAQKEGLADRIHFYLADRRAITEQESLEEIFEKIADPMRQLKEMRWQLA